MNAETHNEISLDDMAADSPEAVPPAEAIGDRLERLSALAEQLRAAQIALYLADCTMKDAEDKERRLREIDIPELMKECNMKEFKLRNGVKIKVEPDLKCGLPKEDIAARERAMAWLRDKGLGGIIKTVVAVGFGKGDESRAKIAAEALRQANFIPEVNEDVHWQTLKATIKEERQKGNHVPPELFSLFEYETTKLEFPPGVEKPKKPRPKK